MPTSLEFEDKLVENAVEKACRELNISKEKLKYDVISYGSSGIFGLVGTKKARIRVTLPDSHKGRTGAGKTGEIGPLEEEKRARQEIRDTVTSLLEETFDERPAPDKSAEAETTAPAEDSQKPWAREKQPDQPDDLPDQGDPGDPGAEPDAENGSPEQRAKADGDPDKPARETKPKGKRKSRRRSSRRSNRKSGKGSAPEEKEEKGEKGEKNGPPAGETASPPLPDPDPDSGSGSDSGTSPENPDSTPAPDLSNDRDASAPDLAGSDPAQEAQAPPGAEDAAADIPAEPGEDFTGPALEQGEAVLQRIIDFITTGASVTLTREKDRALYEVNGGETGVLIGRRGQTLEAIQYLVEKIVNKQARERIRIQVDVEGYLDDRKNRLKNLATRLSEKAKRTGKPVTIGQLNSHDRRIVHISLKDDTGVRTQSMGDGFYRKLVIFPKKKGPGKKKK